MMTVFWAKDDGVVSPESSWYDRMVPLRDWGDGSAVQVYNAQI